MGARSSQPKATRQLENKHREYRCYFLPRVPSHAINEPNHELKGRDTIQDASISTDNVKACYVVTEKL